MSEAAEEKGKMLPGVAGIAMFLLVLTLINVFAALKGAFGISYIRYGVLALCTILVAGLFGLLRMRRWGYAIVLAGALLLSASYFYVFSRVHQAPLGGSGCVYAGVLLVPGAAGGSDRMV